MLRTACIALCYREWFSIAGKIYACMSWLDVELSLNRRSQIRSSTFPFHVSQSRHGEKNESGFYWDASPVHQHINRYLFSGDHQTGAWKGKASKIRLLDHMNLGKPRKARIISSPESACLNREEDAGFAGSLCLCWRSGKCFSGTLKKKLFCSVALMEKQTPNHRRGETEQLCYEGKIHIPISEQNCQGVCSWCCFRIYPFPHGLPFFNSSLRPARRKPMKKEGKPWNGSFWSRSSRWYWSCFWLLQLDKKWSRICAHRYGIRNKKRF